MTEEQPMFTTDLGNLSNRNIFKTSLYIYIFQDEKCRLMRNLSLSLFRHTMSEADVDVNRVNYIALKVSWKDI